MSRGTSAGRAIAVLASSAVLLVPPSTAPAQFDPALHLTEEAAVEACRRLPEAVDTCIAEVAATWGSPAACHHAAERLSCLDLAGDKALQGCDDMREDARAVCVAMVGTELGYAAACEAVLPGDRLICLQGAASTRGDPSIITEHLEGEARDLALMAYVRSTRDLDALDAIQDHEARDAAKILTILPLAMQDGVALAFDHCADLADDYGGEYGAADARINRGLCEEALDRARRWAMAEFDSEREEILREIQADVQVVEAETRTEVKTTTDDGAPLTFYTGQENLLVMEVFNFSAAPLEQLEIEMPGERSFLRVKGVEPAELLVPPGATRRIELAFKVADDAPDGVRQTIRVTARGAGDTPGTVSDPLPVGIVEVELRRRPLTISVGSLEDGFP